MSFEELRASVRHDSQPPAGLAPALQALWYDARGEWDQAHTCAQADEGRDGSWVHAYLHRKEGDRGNAGYWYSRAGRTLPPNSASLEAEWCEIAQALLARKAS